MTDVMSAPKFGPRAITYPHPINHDAYDWPTFSDAEFERRHALVRVDPPRPTATPVAPITPITPMAPNTPMTPNPPMTAHDKAACRPASHQRHEAEETP